MRRQTEETMRTRNKLLALAAACAILAAPVHAADDPALSRDLTSTLQLQGLPCGKVVKSERQGSNDYNATCSDGNRYRVFLNPKGKVVAKKL
jgi:hypothetical protein